MKNRIISIVLSMTLVLALFTLPANAASSDEDYIKDIEFVNALGLGEINPDDIDRPITREEAVLLSLGLYLGRYVEFDYNGEFPDVSADDENAGKLNLAVKNGIVTTTSDGRFVPDGKVSYIEALRMILNSLNYSPLVSASGLGDGKYHMLANQYDINISPKSASAVTVGEMAHMVAMASEAPYMVIKSSDAEGNIQYDYSKNVTALNYNYGIETVEDRVVQNEITSLYTKTPLLKKSISIGGLVLECSEEFDTNYLLGRNIKAYYNEETKELLYVKEDESAKSVELMSDDIEKYVSNTYYSYAGTGTKQFKVTADASFIYNGVALTSDEADIILDGKIFTPENGFVELYGTGSSFDCVKITDYKTYVVSGVDVSGMKIVEKYGLASLDFYNTEKLDIRDSDGNPLDFSYIDADNVLSVAIPYGGSYASIVVNALAVEGMVNSYGNGKIKIESEIFETSALFESRIAGFNPANPDNIISADTGKGIRAPKLGEYVILYLDNLGRVADYKLSPNSGWKYGYIIEKSSLAGTQNINAGLKVRLLTQNGDVEELPVSERLAVDGTKYTSYSAAWQQILTATPVKYRINPQNEIKEIDNPGTVADPKVSGSNEDASALKEHMEFIPDVNEYRDFSYNSSINGITFRHAKDSGNTTIKYFKKGAMVFTVPLDPSDTDEKSYAASLIENSYEKDAQITGNVKVFWEDENEIVDTLLVRYAAVSSNVNKNVYIVDSVCQGLSEDGEAVWKLYLMNGGIVKEFTAEEDGVYDSSNPLTCGDIVRVAASEKREIELIERTFDWENDTVFQIGKKDFDDGNITAENPYFSEGYGVNDDLYLIYGKAEKIRGNIFEISYGSGNTEQFYLNGRVVVVEKTAGGYKLRIGTIDDVVFDPNGAFSSDVVIDVRYAVIRNIVVYK